MVHGYILHQPPLLFFFVPNVWVHAPEKPETRRSIDCTPQDGEVLTGIDTRGIGIERGEDGGEGGGEVGGYGGGIDGQGEGGQGFEKRFFGAAGGGALGVDYALDGVEDALAGRGVDGAHIHF